MLTEAQMSDKRRTKALKRRATVDRKRRVAAQAAPQKATIKEFFQLDETPKPSPREERQTVRSKVKAAMSRVMRVFGR